MSGMVTALTGAAWLLQEQDLKDGIVPWDNHSDWCCVCVDQDLSERWTGDTDVVKRGQPVESVECVCCINQEHCFRLWFLEDFSHGERVREVKHGVFTPLVLYTTGGLGVEATTFYKRLADLISLKKQKQYSTVMCWLRCRLPFEVLRSAIMCVRVSRSSNHLPRCEMNITLATSEGHFT